VKVKEKEQMYDKYLTTHFKTIHEKEAGEFSIDINKENIEFWVWECPL